MRLTPQTVTRALECVWMPSGNDLVCVWVQREQKSASPFDLERERDLAHEIGSDPRRRVA